MSRNEAMPISSGEILGHLFIPGRIPGLNAMMDARIRTHSNRPPPSVRAGKWNEYSTMKQQWNKQIKAQILIQRFPVIEEGYFTYVFDELNRKRDPSNIIAGGIKFIEDALCFAGHLQNDGWNNVLGIRSFWRPKPDRPGVHLLVTPDDTLTFEEAVYEADRPTAPALIKTHPRETSISLHWTSNEQSLGTANRHHGSPG